MKFKLVLLILCCLIPIGAYPQDTTTKKKKILVLHGNLEMSRWQEQVSSRFYKEMINVPDIRVDITFEYLGLNHISSDTGPQNIISYLQSISAVKPIDLVIGVLPRANNFLFHYGQTLFPNASKIFLIPGSTNVNKIQDEPNTFTIPSSSTIALKNNVKSIFSIIPDTRHLIIVCGSGLRDQFYLSVAKKAVLSSDKDFKVDYLVGLPIEELLENVSTLPEKSVILFVTYEEDKQKKKYITGDLFPQLSEKANAPIFAFYDALFGNGIIGGNLTSSDFYAKKTAEISLRFLRGEQSSIFSPIKSLSKDLYDWRQLKRWHIPEDRLPPGSQILYKTETFWEKYITEIIFVLGVFALQTLLIITLLNTLKRRRMAELELVKSESTARALLNTPTETVILVDKNGIVIDANETAIQHFSTAMEKFIGSYVWDFMPEALAKKWKIKVNQVITFGKMLRFEDKFEEKWIDNVLNPIFDELGKVTRVAVIAQDITLRKNAEIELINHRDHLEDLIETRTNKLAKINLELQQEIDERHLIEKALKKTMIALENSNKELDDFAYIASHDLKEPLRGINNFSAFLMEDYGNILDDEGVRKLETLIMLTNRLKQLIDDLMTFSRLGKTELSIQETDMNVILSEVLETLTILIEEKGVEINVPTSLPIMHCDSVRIKEVFRNLLSNAIKYNDKENPWIKIGFFDNKFYISDNGIGIKEKHFSDIFKIFKRLHARNKYGGGTGSGMTIIKKIIEKHNGKIWLESELGQGTTFYFTLGGCLDE